MAMFNCRLNDFHIFLRASWFIFLSLLFWTIYSSLTEKVEKHNNVVENVAILQHDMSTVWMRYDDMKKLIDSVKKKEE